MPSPNVNYVKFLRGTVAAYNALKTANNINSDTLYFIYESASSTTGQLYLGEKLIAGSASADIPESLTALATVLESADAVSFLMADSTGAWKKATPDEVKTALNISSGGDSLTVDSNEFVKVDGTLKLLGFSDASEGLVLSKVNGQVSWTTPVDLTSRVESLESTVGSLDTTIATAISNASHLSYKPVADLAAAESEKTANTIYLVPNGETSGNNIYDEYLVVNNSLEKLNTSLSSPDLTGYVKTSDLTSTLASYVTSSSLTTTLSDYAKVEDLSSYATTEALSTVDGKFDNYVLTTTFNSTVGNLSDFNSYVENETDSIIDMLNVLDQRLTWSELQE